MAVAAETKKSKWASKKSQSKEAKKVVKKEPKTEKTEEKSRKDIKRERKERENPNYHVEMTLKKMWETLRSGLIRFLLGKSGNLPPNIKRFSKIEILKFVFLTVKSCLKPM